MTKRTHLCCNSREVIRLWGFFLIEIIGILRDFDLLILSTPLDVFQCDAELAGGSEFLAD
jgi:hypothetical protein